MFRAQTIAGRALVRHFFFVDGDEDLGLFYGMGEMPDGSQPVRCPGIELNDVVCHGGFYAAPRYVAGEQSFTRHIKQ